MAAHPEYRAEEAEFLENMAGVLGPRAIGALTQIQAAIGLDFAGIDFSLSAAGEILLFEANATMVVTRPIRTSGGPTAAGPSSGFALPCETC